MDTIRIYKFKPPNLLIKNQDQLKSILTISGIGIKKCSLNVKGQNGHFTFRNLNPILKNSSIRLSNLNDARKISDKYLQKINQQMHSNSAFTKSGYNNIFNDIKFQHAFPFTSPDTGEISHWDAVYRPFLKPSSEEEEVCVSNGYVVLSIGNDGLLRTLNCEWTAIESHINSKRYKVHLENDQKDSSQIIYMIEPDKQICAPYNINN
jgi:hypothetical protein